MPSHVYVLIGLDKNAVPKCTTTMLPGLAGRQLSQTHRQSESKGSNTNLAYAVSCICIHWIR